MSGIYFSSFSERVDPQIPCNVAGYGEQSKNALELMEPLEVNGFTIADSESVLSIVQIDTLYASNEIRDEIELRVGHQVQLVASHTHGAPLIDQSKAKLGVFDAVYRDFVIQKIVTALQRNDRIENPLFFVSRGSSDVGIFRRKKAFGIFRDFPFIAKKIGLLPHRDVKIDQAITCFYIFQESKLRTVLWHFACHPVTSSSGNVVSSDFPGFVRDEIRKTHGNDVAVLYLPGASGDIRPCFTRSASQTPWKQRLRFPLEKEHFVHPDRQDMENFRNRLGRSVSECYDKRSQFFFEKIEFKREKFRVSLLRETDGRNVEIPISRLKCFGGYSLVFVGAEVSSQYQILSEKLVSGPMLFCGYADDVFGYLPTERQFIEGGYEGTGFIPMFGLKGSFGKGFSDRFIQRIKEMVDGVE